MSEEVADKIEKAPAEGAAKKAKKTPAEGGAAKAKKTEGDAPAKAKKGEETKVEKVAAAKPAEVQVETDAMAIVMGADVVTSAPAADAKAKKSRVKSIPAGIVHIRASFNNTQCCISDVRGNVISWSSSGKAGFKGSRKSTAFAGTMIAQDCARVAMAKGMHEVEIRVQGAGAGRESAIRAIANSGMAVILTKAIPPIPHNGCRQRKRRRV